MMQKPLAALSASFTIALLSTVSVFGAPALRAPEQSGLTAPVHLTAKQLLPKTQALYETKPMTRSHNGEDQHVVDHGVRIHYMSAEERERARVVILNGTLYTSKGAPVPYGSGLDKLNYAMDAAGNFYILNQTGHPELRHSSFFDGAPVACAGDMELLNGRIVKVDRNSGHYRPSSQMFKNVLTELRKDGVELTDAGRAPSALSR